MAEISDLAILDANNTARWAEGQTVPTLNDAGRADEGILARWFQDMSFNLISTGTGAAYSLTTFRAITSYSVAIGAVTFRAHVINTGAATLRLNGLATKPLVRANGAALVAGDIAANQAVYAAYNASTDKFHCLGITA